MQPVPVQKLVRDVLVQGGPGGVECEVRLDVRPQLVAQSIPQDVREEEDQDIHADQRVIPEGHARGANIRSNRDQHRRVRAG